MIRRKCRENRRECNSRPETESVLKHTGVLGHRRQSGHIPERALARFLSQTPDCIRRYWPEAVRV